MMRARGGVIIVSSGGTSYLFDGGGWRLGVGWGLG